MVGFIHDANTLVKQPTEGDSKLDVLSIIGRGSLGKTTLARKIYNSHMKNHFNCRAWFHGYQECKSKELLLDILSCIMMPKSDEIHKMYVEEQKIKFTEHLKGKR